MDLTFIVESLQQPLFIGGIVTGMIFGKCAKEVLIKFFPATAVIFNIFSPAEKQLQKMLNFSATKNEDLKTEAIKSGLKIAARLIKG